MSPFTVGFLNVPLFPPDSVKLGLDTRFLSYFLGRQDLNTWKGLLERIVWLSGGTVITGPDAIIGGMEDDAHLQEYYNRVR